MHDKYSFNKKLMYVIMKKKLTYIILSLFTSNTVEQNNYFLTVEHLIC